MRSRPLLVVGAFALLAAAAGLAGCGRPTAAGTGAAAGDPASGTRGAGGVPPVLEAQPGDGLRMALLVGVDRYQGTGLRDLDYAEKDVTDLAGVLTGLGYRVTLMTRAEFKRQDKDFLLPTAANVRDQLAALTRERKPGDTVLVGFSGHGVHLKATDRLYYCPTGANLEKEDSLVAADDVLAAFKDCGAGSKVLVMDACRNDPADGRGAGTPAALGSATRPLVPDPPGGTVALFSCSKGQIAHESREHQRGFLFHYLIEGLTGKAANKDGNVTWLGLAEYVGAEVPEAVRREKGPKAAQTPEVRGEARGTLVLASHQLAASETKPGEVRKLAASEPKPGEVRKVEIARGVFMEFCWIPPGEATLGSPRSERSRDADETEHEYVSKGYWLGKYAVTQEEWESVMGSNPSRFDGKQVNVVEGMNTSRFPVEQVSWNDCQSFLKTLNRGVSGAAFGKRGTFVLPHENEWEFACRGGRGNGQPFAFGAELNGTQANCAGNLPYGTGVKGPWLKRTTTAGNYERVAPHPWGLCDLHGNVWQTCENWYDSEQKYRVIRGGSCVSDPEQCRAACRRRSEPDDRFYFIGFRVCFRLN